MIKNYDDLLDRYDKLIGKVDRDLKGFETFAKFSISFLVIALLSMIIYGIR